MKIPAFVLSALAAVLVLAVPLFVPATATVVTAVLSLGLLVALVAALFPVVTGLGAPIATSCVLALSGGAALASTLLARTDEPLLWWPAVVGVTVLALFIVQLLRGHEATDRVTSLASAIAAALLIDSAAGWIPWYLDLVPSAEGPSPTALLCGGVGVVLALLVALALGRRGDTGWGAPDPSSTRRERGNHAAEPVRLAGEDEQRPVGLSIAAAVAAVTGIGMPVLLIGRPLLG